MKHQSLVVFLVSILMATTAFIACTSDSRNNVLAAEHQARALQTLNELPSTFWNADVQMFHNRLPCDNCDEVFHYWWQAHALDVLIDAYELTGDAAWLHRASDLYEGLLSRNGGDLHNDYYDDMLWMALAVLRLYEITGQNHYLTTVQTLWNDIISAWNTSFDGGIPWRRTQLDYKNAPSNGPAVLLAARLYQTTGDETSLEWARRIFDWMQNVLVDPASGLVWDGINRQGDGLIDKQWMFTYNQGTYSGGALALWKITGESFYLQQARRNVQSTLQTLVRPDGVLVQHRQGDGGLFTGILIRYLNEFRGGEASVEGVSHVLNISAEAAWHSRTDQGVFPPVWGELYNEGIDLSTHLSGVMLILSQATSANRGH